MIIYMFFFQYIIKELIYVFSVFLMGDTLELFLFFVLVTVSLNVNFFLEKWVSLCFVWMLSADLNAHASLW
jgi:hypothetical protein